MILHAPIVDILFLLGSVLAKYFENRRSPSGVLFFSTRLRSITSPFLYYYLRLIFLLFFANGLNDPRSDRFRSNVSLYSSSSRTKLAVFTKLISKWSDNFLGNDPGIDATLETRKRYFVDRESRFAISDGRGVRTWQKLRRDATRLLLVLEDAEVRYVLRRALGSSDLPKYGDGRDADAVPGERPDEWSCRRPSIVIRV